jgi:hypothetical protein
METITVKLHKTFIIGITGSLLFLFIMLTSLRTVLLIKRSTSFEDFLLPAVFLFLFVLSFFLLLISRKAYFSKDKITVKTFFGKYSININKIRYIEICSGNMIIGNDSQRFSLPAFEHWDNKSIEMFFPEYESLLKSYNIEIKNKIRAILPVYRNCRLKNHT